MFLMSFPILFELAYLVYRVTGVSLVTSDPKLLRKSSNKYNKNQVISISNQPKSKENQPKSSQN